MKQPTLLLPPFTLETAKQKVQIIEDAWNSKNPIEISSAYSKDSKWYANEFTLLSGRKEIQEFLKSKWEKELDFEVTKRYWAHTDNSIAVQFDYDYRIENGQWYCSYGNEIFEFDEEGLVKNCLIRIYHSTIDDSERPLSQNLVEIMQNI